MSLRSLSICALVGLMGSSSLADDYVFNTDSLTLTRNGSPVSDFNGTPIYAEVSGGIAYFHLNGDLVLNAADTLSGAGSRPLSLQVQNDVHIAAGAEINVSASNRNAGPGGGDGGLGGDRGLASWGMGGGNNGSRGYGGYGGSGGYSYTQSGSPGTSGSGGGDAQDGLDGSPGEDGLIGGDGFNSPAGDYAGGGWGG
ncbi:MAG: hypothetical protein KAV82_12945 [Phycisphaerae bacterium]|nr:hypothetical protein [Phycisphaerae bacterium]